MRGSEYGFGILYLDSSLDSYNFGYSFGFYFFVIEWLNILNMFRE